jgi:hypothetical protein
MRCCLAVPGSELQGRYWFSETRHRSRLCNRRLCHRLQRRLDRMLARKDRYPDKAGKQSNDQERRIDRPDAFSLGRRRRRRWPPFQAIPILLRQSLVIRRYRNIFRWRPWELIPRRPYIVVYPNLVYPNLVYPPCRLSISVYWHYFFLARIPSR